jgi:hypothetical protein
MRDNIMALAMVICAIAAVIGVVGFLANPDPVCQTITSPGVVVDAPCYDTDD